MSGTPSAVARRIDAGLRGFHRLRPVPGVWGAAVERWPLVRKKSQHAVSSRRQAAPGLPTLFGATSGESACRIKALYAFAHADPAVRFHFSQKVRSLSGQVVNYRCVDAKTFLILAVPLAIVELLNDCRFCRRGRAFCANRTWPYIDERCLKRVDKTERPPTAPQVNSTATTAGSLVGNDQLRAIRQNLPRFH